MASMSLAVDARCPLCGSRVLSVSRTGRVLTDDVGAISVSRPGAASAYTLCDDCSVLAALPSNLSLN
jgi:hypothetical protein